MLRDGILFMQYKSIFTLSFFCFFLNTLAAVEDGELKMRVPLKVCREIEYWDGRNKLSVWDFYAKKDGYVSLKSTCDKGFGVWDASKSHVGEIPFSFAKLKYDMSVVKTEESNPGLRGTYLNSGWDQEQYLATKLTYTLSPVDLLLKAGWRTCMPEEGRFVVFGISSVLYHQGKVENESWSSGFVILDAEIDELTSHIKSGLGHGGQAHLEEVVQSLTTPSLKE